MTQISVPRVLSVVSFQALSSPADGDLVTVQVDPTNGVLWTFRYNTSSVSAYKWEFLGGPPMTAIVATDQTNGSASNGVYTDLTTVGPSITLPLNGDYNFSYHALAYGANGAECAIAPKFGASATSDLDRAGGTTITGSAAVARLLGRSEVLRTGLAASTVVKLQYIASNNATNQRWLQRMIAATPVRCS